MPRRSVEADATDGGPRRPAAGEPVLPARNECSGQPGGSSTAGVLNAWRWPCSWRAGGTTTPRRPASEPRW